MVKKVGEVTRMHSDIVEMVVEQLKDLPSRSQWRVLEFARALSLRTPQGIPGSQLLRFAGAISMEDVNAMREMIENSCERVNANEW